VAADPLAAVTLSADSARHICSSTKNSAAIRLTVVLSARALRPIGEQQLLRRRWLWTPTLLPPPPEMPLLPPRLPPRPRGEVHMSTTAPSLMCRFLVLRDRGIQVWPSTVMAHHGHTAQSRSYTRQLCYQCQSFQSVFWWGSRQCWRKHLAYMTPIVKKPDSMPLTSVLHTGRHRTCPYCQRCSVASSCVSCRPPTFFHRCSRDFGRVIRLKLRFCECCRTFSGSRPWQSGCSGTIATNICCLRQQWWLTAFPSFRWRTYVRDLGIYIDGDLNMRTHVQRTASSCFAALRQLRPTRRLVPSATFQSLVVALVHCRMDQYAGPYPAYLVCRCGGTDYLSSQTLWSYHRVHQPALASSPGAHTLYQIAVLTFKVLHDNALAKILVVNDKSHCTLDKNHRYRLWQLVRW